ncbi:MAG: carbamoyltransferase HypF [Candidatus Aenigmarchaeota archaeon ex4484_56]|nr:MAG: carbamoyltransferase HypF [Candidatus Aenigmarchaeota archaeon ex4484_56]
MQIRIKVKGIVQGVGFRPFVYRIAKKLNLCGYVKNTNSNVEILVQGNKNTIRNFIEILKRDSPPIAKIENLDICKVKMKRCIDFEIVKSRNAEDSSILIPPDIGICKNCIEELKDKKDRRYNHLLITCTNCGPRFTILEKTPYDRDSITMRKFSMCKLCESEYKNPITRRYHAQTISCKKCGPRIYLKDRNFKKIKNPIKTSAKFLRDGKIICIKGIGGFHLCCISTDDNVVKRLRIKRKNSEQPFAVMAETIDTIRKFAIISDDEEKIISSWGKPIVILKKSEDYYLSKYVAPCLDTIGVMLPYSPIYHLLFEFVDEPIVVTSANLKDEPTAIKDSEIYILKNIADYFLIHTRRIYNRCDDSVVKFIDPKSVFIRRSRGYVPLPINLNLKDKKIILGVGAEKNNTFALYKNGKVYLSQHIGDIYSYGEFNSLKESLVKWLKILKINKIDAIVSDLHPEFNTTKFAIYLSKKYKCNLIKVQHHIAHFSSCLGEYNLDDSVGIICDGYGYGFDRCAWGGEVIKYKNKKFCRIGHLEYQPLIGLDYATKDIVRIAVGIMSKFLNDYEIRKFVKNRGVDIWLKQLRENFNVVETSSCGRFFDAVSVLLGICNKRTYEGEPAMKLESIARKGEIIKLPVKIKTKNKISVLDTTSIFKTIFEKLNTERKEDLAISAHYAIAKGLAKIAGHRNVCFSGGVAYNELMNKFLKEEIGDLKIQTKVPCGDGGISFGQIYYFLKGLTYSGI